MLFPIQRYQKIEYTLENPKELSKTIFFPYCNSLVESFRLSALTSLPCQCSRAILSSPELLCGPIPTLSQLESVLSALFSIHHCKLDKQVTTAEPSAVPFSSSTLVLRLGR